MFVVPSLCFSARSCMAGEMRTNESIYTLTVLLEIVSMVVSIF